MLGLALQPMASPPLAARNMVDDLSVGGKVRLSISNYRIIQLQLATKRGGSNASGCLLEKQALDQHALTTSWPSQVRKRLQDFLDD